MISVKREVLSERRAKRAEVPLEDAPEIRWHDLHIEPLRNARTGDVVGLTCASGRCNGAQGGRSPFPAVAAARVDASTSKNLLAVSRRWRDRRRAILVQSQTFLTQFGARLQALAASHDLLVRESWYGASLGELVRSQLGGYLDGLATQISIEGPAIASNLRLRKIWAWHSTNLQ